ncbi:hypothetical protein PHYSODRAFT_339332 [Phytophthora sojae]|uniref:Uncharacterized protein n=1 Tax=Phytophthora sojae (strain P6497) TaxID=1094619 RepID=G5A6G6_PHYSP|nr:hypothetical protein PHYSODRAFT_339332 [Phytophthora sojae]EGZ08921.1 hypothetical protein PHYSODRAFT_339332 [Phytophthora sojae]|eukprot:XP_009535554.1 hypothetical protein PHYSODRAFT_339332 [Phytophthora sojae]
MALDALYPVAQASGEIVNVHILAVIKGCVVSHGYVALMEATVEYSVPSSSLRFVTQDSGVFAIKSHRLQPSAGDSQACRLYSTTKIHSNQRYKPEVSRRTVEADLAISSLRKFVNTRHQFLDNMVLLNGR